MKEIKLTQGKTTLVDDADYVQLNKFKWHVFQNGYTSYAVRNVSIAKNKRKEERMHRAILGLQRGDKRECDHRDGNGLNNQRANLRICTGVQNGQSRRKVKVGTSKYKGVYWHRDACKWLSRVQINGKKTHLGLFDSEAIAAEAYDAAAIEHYGAFALTNKMLGLL